MPEWKSFEVPEKLIGEQRVSKSTYVTTYQTEILLPKSSQYADYCFLHPSKLISGSRSGARITYNDSFTFTLIKRDREPGKRYRRYTLTVREILDIYEPEMARVREREEKKEARRLAQVGTVEAVVCRSYDGNRCEPYVLFCYKKKCYYGTGEVFGREDTISRRCTVAEDVSREVFEKAREDLKGLQDSFGMVYDVWNAIYRRSADDSFRFIARQIGSGNTADQASIYDSFDSLCQLWEIEFHDKIKTALASAGHSEREGEC